jgi:hypothetical protein
MVKTLVVPSLHEPLLSIAGLCDAGLTVVFTKSSCDIFDSKEMLLGRAIDVGTYTISHPSL